MERKVEEGKGRGENKGEKRREEMGTFAVNPDFSSIKWI